MTYAVLCIIIYADMEYADKTITVPAAARGGKEGHAVFAKKKPTSFGTLTLSISGMRASVEYEMINKGSEAEVSYYIRYLAEEGTERRLEKRAYCSVEAALELLGDCGVPSWNGFHGKHPRGVLDGEMFRLEAVIDGERVCADGSQNFPKGFRELREGLYRILNGEG